MAPVGDLVDFQVRVLGLSAEYQALGHWFVASGGLDFRSYLASYCPHLHSDFRADFASGSLRFLAALSSASLPLPFSSVLSSVSSVSFSSQPPVAPVPVSSSLPPSAPPLRFPAALLTSLPSSTTSALPPVFRPPPVSLAPHPSLPDWRAVHGGSGVTTGLSVVPASLPVPPPPAPPLFCPFVADPAPLAQVPAASLMFFFPLLRLRIWFRALLSLPLLLIPFLRLLLLPS